MKYLSSQFLAFLHRRDAVRNVVLLTKYFIALVLMIALYTIAFHYIMAREGREFSWMTGFYWTLTIMTTLGLGDITFSSDLGRAFSILVTISGVLILMIVLPYTFIQFFYAPWIKSRAASRVSRQAPLETRGHVILTHLDPVTQALIKRLKQYGHEHTLIVPELNEALNLHDQGFEVLYGFNDDPETYKLANIKDAALVATTASDAVNSNVVFTVRELSSDVPIISTAEHAASVDILQLAGSSKVIELYKMLGTFLARRTCADTTGAHVIGSFGDLLIAEATATGTSLVGRLLRDTKIREEAGVSVVGVWEHGQFRSATPDVEIHGSTVLVLAGSGEQMKRFDAKYGTGKISGAPVLIIGGGKVGRSAAAALKEKKIDYRILEKTPEQAGLIENCVPGDAAELNDLKRAGIMETSSIIITTNDDDMNMYLTIYCRRLRPDVQLICRSTKERNAATLQRAGADFVMSYASLGAGMIFNSLKKSGILMLAEGVDVFKVAVPAMFAGKSPSQLQLRKRTGCTLIAVREGKNSIINPEPTQALKEGSEIVLIGNSEAERLFFEYMRADRG